jgi:hypothetical protein
MKLRIEQAGERRARDPRAGRPRILTIALHPHLTCAAPGSVTGEIIDALMARRHGVPRAARSWNGLSGIGYLQPNRDAQRTHHDDALIRVISPCHTVPPPPLRRRDSHKCAAMLIFPATVTASSKQYQPLGLIPDAFARDVHWACARAPGRLVGRGIAPCLPTARDQTPDPGIDHQASGVPFPWE